MGNKVVGDIHLGDWGYQMGLIITELKKRQPDLPYFDDNFTGEYPKEAPFTISDLEEIYPAASAYAKEHDDYREEALDATFQLQSGKARLPCNLGSHYECVCDRLKEKLCEPEC